MAEPLAIRFLLRPRAELLPCVVEEGPVRVLAKDFRGVATFPLPTPLHFPVALHSAPVSPFALSTSAVKDEVRRRCLRGEGAMR